MRPMAPLCHSRRARLSCWRGAALLCLGVPQPMGISRLRQSSLLPASGFQSTVLVPGMEEETEIVAVPGPSES